MAENEQVEPEADETEMMEQLREELKSLTVSDHLLFMMHSLSALAVDRMGLTEQAGGRRDVEEARLAIDAFKALLELVGKTRSPEEMAAHRSVLSQLQMSYVAVLSGGGPGEAAPGEAAEESSQATVQTRAATSPEETSEAPPTEATAAPPTEATAAPPTEATAAPLDETLGDESPGEARAETPQEAPTEVPAEASGDVGAREPTAAEEGQE